MPSPPGGSTWTRDGERFGQIPSSAPWEILAHGYTACHASPFTKVHVYIHTSSSFAITNRKI